MTLKWDQLRPETQARLSARLQGGRAREARHVGGKRARAAGKVFEEEVRRAAMEQRAVVSIERLPDCGARFVGKGRAHPEPICCDFVGCIVGTGRGIYFDAKGLAKAASFDLANTHLVKIHQTNFLHTMAEAGAIAGLLVKCRAGILWLDGRHLLGVARLKWEDKRWHCLGESIDFGKLVRL